MADLELISNLGRHLDDTAGRVAEMPSEGTGLTVHHDPSRSSLQRRRMIGVGAIDLVWMCGYLTRRLTERENLELDILAAPVFTGPDTGRVECWSKPPTDVERHAKHVRGASEVPMSFEDVVGKLTELNPHHDEAARAAVA